MTIPFITPNTKYRVPGYLILAALFLYGLGKWSGAQGAESSLVIRSAEQSLAMGKASRARQAHLKAVAQAFADSARAFQKQSSIRGALVSQLDTALSRASTERDSLRVSLQQTVQLRGQVSELELANGLLERARAAEVVRADQAEARVAELERNLSATLHIADCRILSLSFMPRCPSRTVSAVVGFGVGALAVLVVKP